MRRKNKNHDPLYNLVCSECIGDSYLKNIIKENLSENFCNYCKRQSEVNISTELLCLKNALLLGIQTEYCNPDEVLSYEDLFKNSYSACDLDWFIQEEVEISDGNLLKDIINMLDGYYWCDNPSGYNISDDLSNSWSLFVYLIKHRYRYTFFSSQEKQYGDCNFEIYPQDILDIIGAMTPSLTKTIPKGTQFYRVRSFLNNEQTNYLNASDLGSPPIEKSKNTRMSPAGIPIFYGSIEESTALAEIGNSKIKKNIIANFDLLLDINILDLSNLYNIPIPSLFDLDQTLIRKSLKFLKNFSLEISKTIKSDENEHIEYIPTQIITEYFRYLYKDNEKNIDGIFYNSSKSEGINCALFFDNTMCVNKIEDNNSKLLLKKYYEQK